MPPAHCVMCGYETTAIPRPDACSKCGAREPWGSPLAPYPSKVDARRARDRWRKKKRRTP